VKNTILWANSTQIELNSSTITVTYSCVQGGCTGDGNVGSDPLFVTSIDYNNSPTTDGNFHLTNAGSSCLNTGTSDGAPETDLEGNARIGAPEIGAYEYTSVDPEIVSISPNAGTNLGNTSVTITGLNFGAQGTGTVTFDGTEAQSYTSWQDDEIVCVTPAHAVATVDLVVTVNDGKSVTVTDGFAFVSPAIATIEPELGTASGGTSVTITGSYFGSQQGTVTFGGTAVQSYTSWSDTQIICSTPAHDAGLVDVVVANANGDTGTKTDAFTYKLEVCYVRTTGNDSNSGGSWNNAKATISSAIGVTLNNGTILVEYGTYNITSLLNLGGKNFILASDDGTHTSYETASTDASQCILDANGSCDKIIYSLSGETSDFVVDGFTLRESQYGLQIYYSSPTIKNCVITDNSSNGIDLFSSSPTIQNCTISNNSSSGILCSRGSCPTIENCTISGNTSSFYIYGGGITCRNSSPIIKGCIVSDNSSAVDGGGICCYKDSSSYNTEPTIQGCTISGNSASDDGGGIYSTSEAYPIIKGCTISENTASGKGGGIYLSRIRKTIENCTISGNSAGNGGGIYLYRDYYSGDRKIQNCIISGNKASGYGGGIYCYERRYLIILQNCTISGNSAVSNGGGIYSRSPLTVVNTILWGNSTEVAGTYTITYSCIKGGYTGTGNISSDPLFAMPIDHNLAPTTAGNFYIQSVSPCKNAGTSDNTPETDIVGRARVGTPDIGAYEYQPVTPEITSISNNTGTAAGGTSVTITGSNFCVSRGTGKVTFAGREATSYTSWSATEIVCVTPSNASPSPGLTKVDVVVTNNDDNSATETDGFTYVSPSITSVSPDFGTATGGVEVTISGEYFDAERGSGTVVFDQTEATSYTSWSDTEIVCVTPVYLPRPAGFVDVIVTDSDGASTTKSSAYTYVAPLITSVSPTSGTGGGGTEVTIIGQNFDLERGTGRVTFGGTPAQSYTSWSDTQIVCVTPARDDGGLVDVVVTDNDAASTTKSSAYTYLVPTITLISPDSGTAAGNTAVTITGENFGSERGSGSVKFDNLSASYTSWSDTEIVCVTPAHAPGLVDVVVTDKDGANRTETDGYRYLKPEISSISPGGGYMGGGTTVTITGENFWNERGSGTVTFDGTPAQSYTNWSDTAIVCVTPAHTPTSGLNQVSVDIVVTDQYGISATKTDGFIYFKPTISAISPESGPGYGGTEVTITGENFGTTRGSGSVKFDGVPATEYASWSNTQIICVTPAHGSGAVAVVVTTDQYGSATEVDGFAFYGSLSFITKTDDLIWYFIGTSVNPDNPEGDSLFGDWEGVLLEDWTVARWNSTLCRYERPKGLSQSGAGKGLPESDDYFVPGTAWWITKRGKDGETYSFSISGSPITDDTDGNYTHEIPVKAGWNMFANPFPSNRAWNDDGITLTYTKDGQIYSEQPIASASACTDGKIYRYDKENDSYPPGIKYDAGHIMGVSSGYWIKMEEGITDATLNITSKAAEASEPVYTAVEQNPSITDWRISITASIGDSPNSGEFGGATIIAGTSEQARATADALDDRQPPPSPNEHPVNICFDHRDWPSWPGKYRRDIRPIDNSIIFPIELTMNRLGNQVKLDFDFENLPEDYHIWLYDKAANEYVELLRSTQQANTEHYTVYFSSPTVSSIFELVLSNLPRGDMTRDGKLTKADASLILRHVVGLTELQTDQRILGDVTGDGTISAYDAFKVMNDK